MIIDDYCGADSNVKSAPGRADVDALVTEGALEPLGFYGREHMGGPMARTRQSA